MNDYHTFPPHIDRARYERNMAKAEMIADVMLGAWSGLKHLAGGLKRLGGRLTTYATR